MRASLLMLLSCSVALVAAGSPLIGTWKLNTAKSKFAPGTAIKEMTVVFEQDGNNLKRTVTGTKADGTPINQISTVPSDGKDHKVDAPSGPVITVAITPVNDHVTNVTVKADGKVVSSAKVVLSEDGRIMTETARGKDSKGRKVDNTEVFEKQ